MSLPSANGSERRVWTSLFLHRIHDVQSEWRHQLSGGNVLKRIDLRDQPYPEACACRAAHRRRILKLNAREQQFVGDSQMRQDVPPQILRENRMQERV